jgi:hypothetical protein
VTSRQPVRLRGGVPRLRGVGLQEESVGGQLALKRASKRRKWWVMRRSIPYVAAVGVAAVAVAVLAIDSSASRGVNGCVRDRIDLAGLGKSSSLVSR